MTKTLIIGQGIAGTLLAWSLRKRGHTVHLADGKLAGGSTVAAAGIVNPVTGKRFVKSWRFDEFYPIAKSVYQQLEQELGVPIWEERPILRLLGTVEEANDWSLRCAQDDYAEHLSETTDAGAWTDLLKPGFRYGLIRKSARANIALLASAYRGYALSEGFFWENNLDNREIESLLGTYDRVVFCEGWRAENNPFFPEANFRVSKGEALIIRFNPEHNAGPVPAEMLKKTLIVAPIGSGNYWVGSTYRWYFDDVQPSEDGRGFILNYLNEMFKAPFEVADHIAGIRPTMVDRRPVVERSVINPRVFMFNGLGTKGALLAPFFAEQLADGWHTDDNALWATKMSRLRRY